ncbi:MAG: hypothetical protein CV081_05075 [Nitrospira sp. LK265]|nr:hypothetical protein [Nitrospira sp. LK265]
MTQQKASFEELCANSEGCIPYGQWRSKVRAKYQCADIVSASGCLLLSSDGREFIDFGNAFGSVLIGHADVRINSAAIAALNTGLPAGLGKDLAAQIAAELASDLGLSWKTAFYQSGTSAVRACVLAARRLTGRRVVVSAGFHGWDLMWTSAASPFTENNDGVVDFLYDPEALDDILKRFSDQVAAVVISPDYLHCSAETLRRIAAIAKSYGVPIVSDEVKYGYRFVAGPSITRLGIVADAYVYAKGIGNGWPIACVVGDDSLLAQMTDFASTLTYSCPALAAAMRTLRLSKELDVRSSIERNGGRFIEEAKKMLSHARLPISVVGSGSSFQFVALNPEVESVLVSIAYKHCLFMQPGDQQLPSYAFRDEIVERAIQALDAAVGELTANFPHLVDTQLDDEAWLHAAWMQMDGLSDRITSRERRHKFVYENYGVT